MTAAEQRVGLSLFFGGNYITQAQRAQTATKNLIQGVRILGLSMSKALVIDPIKEGSFGFLGGLTEVLDRAGEFENKIIELSNINEIAAENIASYAQGEGYIALPRHLRLHVLPTKGKHSSWFSIADSVTALRK